jgi:hypothetical protein
MNTSQPNSALNNFGILPLQSVLAPMQPQSTAFMNFSADGGMETRGDLMDAQSVVMAVLDFAGHAKIGKVGGSFGKSVSPQVTERLIQTPTYQLTSEFIYDDDNSRKWMARHGVSYFETMQLICDMAHINARLALAMVGGGGANEGLFNAAGLTIATALLAVDNTGEVRLLFQNVIQVQNATFKLIMQCLLDSGLSHGYAKPIITITTSRRVDLFYASTPAIVESPGPANRTSSIRDNLNSIFESYATLEWLVDDASCLDMGTAGIGNDRMLIQIKEKPAFAGTDPNFDVNKFGNNLPNQSRANAKQVMSSDAPRYIEAASGFSTHVRAICDAVTCGWMIRPMGAIKVSNIRVI